MGDQIGRTNPDDLEDEELKAACEKQWERYNRNLAQHRDELDFVRRLNQALEEDHYFLAMRLLEERNDYEYEGFEVQTLTVV